jgi:hypothetical protein
MIDMTRLPYIALALLAACGGDDEVSHSEPVGISLSVASGDVDGDGRLVDEKNINTESGNPYGVFSDAAQDAVGGTPSSITVDAVTLEIDDASGVAAFEEIFAGDVELSFVMNGSEAVYPVSIHGVADGDGAGPVDMHVHFDSDGVTDEDYPDLVSGSFKVVLEGDAADGFDGLGADADLLAVLTFTAYE